VIRHGKKSNKSYGLTYKSNKKVFHLARPAIDRAVQCGTPKLGAQIVARLTFNAGTKFLRATPPDEIFTVDFSS
jgi:hypothetical protein